MVYDVGISLKSGNEPTTYLCSPDQLTSAIECMRIQQVNIRTSGKNKVVRSLLGLHILLEKAYLKTDAHNY